MTREDIERYALTEYAARQMPTGEYELQLRYRDAEDLDDTMHKPLPECDHQADLRHCFTEGDAQTVDGEWREFPVMRSLRQSCEKHRLPEFMFTDHRVNRALDLQGISSEEAPHREKCTR